MTSERSQYYKDVTFEALLQLEEALDPVAYRSKEPPDQTVRKLLSGEILPTDRVGAIKAVYVRDLHIASAGKHSVRALMDAAQTVVHDDNIYRVSIFPDGVDVVCFGLSSIDSDIDGHYHDTDDLPEWVKERLAVLMIMDSKPPTSDVEGIGRRISSHVYWVYAPETTS
jgi:hypothetical protein